MYKSPVNGFFRLFKIKWNAGQAVQLQRLAPWVISQSLSEVQKRLLAGLVLCLAELDRRFRISAVQLRRLALRVISRPTLKVKERLSEWFALCRKGWTGASAFRDRRDGRYSPLIWKRIGMLFIRIQVMRTR